MKPATADVPSEENGLPEDLSTRLKEEAWQEAVKGHSEEDPLLVEIAMLRFGLKELQAELEMASTQEKRTDLRKTVAKVERDLRLLTGKSPRAGDGWRPGITHQELMGIDFPPIRWIVEGLLPVGAAVLAGKPKLGKSFMALQLCQAVASGTPFLGLATTKAPVLMIALEDSPRRIKGRLELQMATADLAIDYEWVWEPLDGKGYEALRKRLEKGGPHGPYGLVVIDTLASAKSGKIDENKAADMGRLIYPLQRVAHEFQCALVLVFHHRKGAIDDPTWDIRGSGATPGAVDVLIGLYKDRGSGDYCLLSESRDAPELQLKVEFDAAHTYSWQLVGNLNEIARNEAEEDILAALEELGGEADAGAIGKELDKSRKNVRKVCRRLDSRGILDSRVAKTGSGSAKILYTLSYKDEVQGVQRDMGV